jgi:hypothetical protein
MRRLRLSGVARGYGRDPAGALFPKSQAASDLLRAGAEEPLSSRVTPERGPLLPGFRVVAAGNRHAGRIVPRSERAASEKLGASEPPPNRSSRAASQPMPSTCGSPGMPGTAALSTQVTPLPVSTSGRMESVCALRLSCRSDPSPAALSGGLYCVDPVHPGRRGAGQRVRGIGALEYRYGARRDSARD